MHSPHASETPDIAPKTTLLMLSSPPGQDMEALELALALAAFEHPVSVLLLGSGIGWLNTPQQPRKPGGKSPDKLMSALPMYDIEQVFYRVDDTNGHASPAGRQATLATGLSNDETRHLIQQHHHCLSF